MQIGTVDTTMSDDDLMALIAPPEPAKSIFTIGAQPKPLKAAVMFVSGVIPNRTNLPVLGMMRCEVKEHTTFTATDLDVTVEATVDTSGCGSGACLIPKKPLIAALKNAKRVIEIEAMPKETVAISSDGMTQKAIALPTDEFPPQPKLVVWKKARVNRDALIAALRRVHLAMSEDDSRYVINSALLEVHPAKLVIVATDGRRLHKTEVPRLDPESRTLEEISAEYGARRQALLPKIREARRAAKLTTEAAARGIQKALCADLVFQSKALKFKAAEALKPAQIVVPRDTVLLLTKIPDAGAGKAITIEAEGAAKDTTPRASFTCGAYRITTRLVDGGYPRYTAVIPDKFTRKAVIESDAFAAALRHVKVASTPKSIGCKLAFTRNSVTLTCNSPDHGEASAAVPVKFTDADLNIMFNPEYLLDICDTFKGETITIDMDDELSPPVFGNANGIAVVMPMRLS